MRKYLVGLLAIPVLLAVYPRALLRRSAVARTGLALGLGAIVGLAAIAVAQPAPTTATPPTPIVPLTQAAFRTMVSTGVELDGPATITFSTPMDPLSVQAAISVVPPTPVEILWNETATALTIVPADLWAAGTYHTITVEPGALARTGRPMTRPARASFLTRGPAAAVLGVSERIGKRVALDAAFTISFDRPVDAGSVAGNVRFEPPVTGTFSEAASIDGLPRFTFTPDAALRSNTRYRLVVDGVRDDDGIVVAPATLAVRTAVAPEIVRFRPRANTKDVDRSADVSVRFSRAMDRASTRKAFALTVDGKAVAGKITFAESDKVLVFDPAKALPYDVRVTATVAASAVSAEGSPLEAAGKVAFRTEKKPAPKKVASSGSSSGGSSGGGSAGSGSWTSVERYYLGLMNCTRTGGWVTSSGSCSSPGGRDVAALRLDAGISSKVARPYAKLLATRGACSHFIGGTPGDRLRRAGYRNYTWAENIGCRSGSPKGAVLGSHLFFQSEKSYLGGHYVNLMNRKYDRAGIGVWVASGRVRLVVDFYHP